MQARNSPTQNTPTWICSSCAREGSASVHAITPSAAVSIARITSRLYQPLPSKQRMNVSRYSVSGTIHSSGTDATLVVMWLLTASSRTEPVAASAHHRIWRASGGRGFGCGGGFGFGAGQRRHRIVGGHASALARPRGGHREGHEHHVAGRPRPGLHARRDPGLDQERVAQQREHRREVGQREQPIRIAAGKPAREPGLHQRARRRQQEVRQADRRGQQAQDLPDRILVAGGLPERARHDRQQRETHEQQRDVQAHLRAGCQPAHDDVRVQVAQEQRGLEEHEARRPHRGGPAEPRQDLLRDDGLDQEQQERATEDRQCEKGHREGSEGNGARAKVRIVMGACGRACRRAPAQCVRASADRRFTPSRRRA